MALDETQPEEGADTEVEIEESSGDEEDEGIVEHGQVRQRSQHDEDSSRDSQQPAHKMQRQQPDAASSKDES